MSLVLYETDGQIGIITLNRPKMHNCMNVAMIKELDQVLDNVDLKTIRCLIITGTGDAFSSGSDINELVKLNSRQAMEYSEMGNDVFQKIGEFFYGRKLSRIALQGFDIGLDSPGQSFRCPIRFQRVVSFQAAAVKDQNVHKGPSDFSISAVSLEIMGIIIYYKCVT